MNKLENNNFIKDEVRRDKMGKLLNALSVSFDYNEGEGIFSINDRLLFFLSGDVIFFELKFPKMEGVDFEQFNKDFQKRYLDNRISIVSEISFISDEDSNYVERRVLGDFGKDVEELKKRVEELFEISISF